MAIFRELTLTSPKRRFTSGIIDDVTGLSLAPVPAELPVTHRLSALFYGLGSDGTVSAAKNAIQILGSHTDNYAQGFFVYDSKKAGGLTVSHLRISEQPIRATYLIRQADFIACHQWQFLDKYEMAEKLAPGGIFLLNSPYPADEVWHHIPQDVQAILAEKQAQLYVINAYRIARECRLGARINTVMQMAFSI